MTKKLLSRQQGRILIVAAAFVVVSHSPSTARVSGPAGEFVAGETVSTAEALVSTTGFPDVVRESGHDGRSRAERTLLVSSADQLSGYFGRVNYRLDDVRDRGEVPRLYLVRLPSDLRKLRTSSQRKAVFIKTALPLILRANELIAEERARLIELQARAGLSGAEREWGLKLAQRYGFERLDFAKLLERVDVVPPSLALAQAAEESGWGTSRFARTGNALFGQRVFKQKIYGMVPQERAVGKTFRVRAFDGLLDSVRAYFHNLNTHPAYESFRKMRARMRKGGAVDSYVLAGTLEFYAERRGAYVKTIRKIMLGNNMHVYDRARLGE